MRKYKNFIRNCLKKNYKGITSFDKSLIKNLFLYRKDFLAKIKNKTNVKNFKKDKTYQNLKKIYFENKLNKNQKKILIYYRKFEVNTSLKRFYDNRFKKKTNSETNYCSYIYLGLLLYKCKKLNIYQKLNCILKILDKICSNPKNNKDLDKLATMKLFKLENYLIQRIKK